ncbi:MAG: CARDB domain-containing protein [Candidatus Buchananbacteria bacterium]|nr:CARDB domain-containing protein [Candidatus Buchananbacteria bacterium]
MRSKIIVFAPLFLLLALFLFPSISLAADADLSVESVSFSPAQPLVNQTTKIIVRIKYTGSSSLTSNSSVNSLAFAHNDFQQITSPETGASVNPSSSNPLYSGTYFTYTVVGKFINAGTKTLSLKIDWANSLDESNENNNLIMPKVDVLKSGDLIKLPNDSAIYLIKADNQKHLFVNGPTFWSYHRGNWGAIKLDGSLVYIQQISQTAFDSIATGSNIGVKSGSRLIKFQNSSRIYTVFGLSKIKLISDQTALSLYGSKWKDKVVTIQNGFEADYIRADQDFFDSDSDGLSDEDERNVYYTNPYNNDSDGDSYKDGSEVFFDYSPSI